MVAVLSSLSFFGVGAQAHAETIKLAYSKTLYAADVIVALERGLFTKHSVDVEPQIFASGKLTLDAVMAGAADLSTTAETPITAAVMAGRPIVVLGRLIKAGQTLVVNSGAGINSIADLRGKKLGITAGTGSEVSLYEALRRNAIKTADVTLVNLRPEDMAAALANGSVDAINTYQPHVFNAQRLMGDKAKILDTRGIYSETFNLVAMRDVAVAKSKAISNVLAALLEAEAFLAEHKPEAVALLSKVIGLDAAVVEQSWPNFEYRVALDSNLVDVFKAHSQWRLDTGNLPPGVTKVPDFLLIIMDGPLKSVAPDRISIPSQ
jgi:NitT/TauT family transport system substrate-binding protein